MPISLYRYFDKDDRLLYAGISHHPFKREGQHKQSGKSMTEVRHIELEWFDNRQEAIAAENWAIVRERPLWNKAKVHKKRRVKKTPTRIIRQSVTPFAYKPPEVWAYEETDREVSIRQFIGPHEPYYWIALTHGEAPSLDVEWIVGNPQKAMLFADVLRPGDIVWTDSEMPERFWEMVSKQRAHRLVRDKMIKHTGSARRTPRDDVEGQG